MGKAAVNKRVRPFGGHKHLCLEYTPKSEVAGSEGRCIFSKANTTFVIKEI